MQRKHTYRPYPRQTASAPPFGHWRVKGKQPVASAPLQHFMRQVAAKHGSKRRPPEATAGLLMGYTRSLGAVKIELAAWNFTDFIHVERAIGAFDEDAKRGAQRLFAAFKWRQINKVDKHGWLLDDCKYVVVFYVDFDPYSGSSSQRDWKAYCDDKVAKLQQCARLLCRHQIFSLVTRIEHLYATHARDANARLYGLEQYRLSKPKDDTFKAVKDGHCTRMSDIARIPGDAATVASRHRVVAFDCETTGMTDEDRVIQLALVTSKCLPPGTVSARGLPRVTKAKVFAVWSDKKACQAAQALHNISPSTYFVGRAQEGRAVDVPAGGQDPFSVFSLAYRMITTKLSQGYILIGYNAIGFDVAKIAQSIELYRGPTHHGQAPTEEQKRELANKWRRLSSRVLDVYLFAKSHLTRSASSKKLEDLHAVLGKSDQLIEFTGSAHDAQNDCFMTINLFRAFESAPAEAVRACMRQSISKVAKQ